MPSARIEYDQLAESPSRSLETRAAAIAARVDWGDASIPATVVREMALVLDHLGCVRSSCASHQQRLLEIECYYTADLRELSDRGEPLTSSDAMRVRRVLDTLQQSRLDLASQAQCEVRALQVRLLELLNRHSQISLLEDGYGEDRSKA